LGVFSLTLSAPNDIMKSIKVKIGDIYAIPLGNGEYGYTQLIDITPYKYFAVFDYKSSSFPEVQSLIKQEIIILTITIDVDIKNHNWPFIGNIAPPSWIVIPNYIVSTLKEPNAAKIQIIVVDRYGKYLREATEKDQRTLFHQSSVSPALFEHLIKYKLLGVGDYEKIIDKFLYKASRE
jgi:hypothetical protein